MQNLNWKRIGAFILMSWFLIPIGAIFLIIWTMIGLTQYAVTGQWDDPDDTGW